jgi:hypothetical protein
MQLKKGLRIKYKLSFFFILILVFIILAGCTRIVFPTIQIKNLFSKPESGSPVNKSKDSTKFILFKDKDILLKNNKIEFEIKSGISSKSIFNIVQWIKIKEKNNVILYMQNNKSDKINHYKSVRILNSNQGEKLYKNLMDFKNYSKIFPRTILYQKIKDISNGKYLMYCQANFKPFKNRDYYIILEYSITNENNKKEWVIEWYPVGANQEKFLVKKDFKRVEYLYGRWIILEAYNKTKISVELFNNFVLPVSKGLAASSEKSSAIEMIDQIVKYTTGK